MKKQVRKSTMGMFVACMTFMLQMPVMAAEPLPADWQQLSFADKAQLAEDHFKNPDNTQASIDARAALKEHLWTNYFGSSDFSAAGDDGMRHLRMAKRIYSSISDSRKTQLRNLIASKYVNDRDNLAALKGGGWFWLSYMQQETGATKSQIAEMSADWATASRHMQSMKMKELALLLQYMEEGETNSINNAKAQTVVHSWTNYLNNAALVIAPEDRAGLIYLAKRTLPSLDNQQKEILISNLMSQLIENIDADQPLEGRDWRHLDVTFVKLGATPTMRAQAASTWITSNSNWQQLEPLEMGHLVEALSGGGQLLDTPMVANVVAKVLEVYLTPQMLESGSNNLSELLLCAYYSILSCNNEQKTQIVDSLMTSIVNDSEIMSNLPEEQFNHLYMSLGRGGASKQQKTNAATTWMQSSDNWQSAQLEVLAGIVRDLHDSEVAVRKSIYTDLASVLANRSNETPSWDDEKNWTYVMLAHALEDPANRDIVRTQLEGPDGSARLVKAKLLAWANRQNNTLDAWKSLLDAKLADPEVSGDKKASWLIARAYAESIHDFSMLETFWLGGRRWLEEGLVVAGSETVRLQCVDYLLEGYVASHNFDAGVSVLDSIEGQFTSQAAIERLAHWRENIPVMQAYVEQAAADQVEQSDAAWRSEIERRLQTAIKKGDTRRIRRFQSILDRNP